MQMGKNNRQNVRLSSMIPIQVLLEDHSVVEALVDNIGFGGVKLLMSIPVPVGQFVRLAIRYQNIVVTVAAESIWFKTTGSVTYNYCVGFAFQGVSAATYQKIRELLFNLADQDHMEL
jgi:hypothetical protein